MAIDGKVERSKMMAMSTVDLAKDCTFYKEKIRTLKADIKHEKKFHRGEVVVMLEQDLRNYSKLYAIASEELQSRQMSLF